MTRPPRLIAYYLPQFHPIPENDAWWGKGFTEWTNVTKAKPLFRGHKQSQFPADLGYYDLRVPEVREAQADMARVYGIEGFCYYHYWFGNGKQLLERPFREVLASGKPNFPFCLCWANETWKGVWFGASRGKTLIEQIYPGKSDYESHFETLRPAFEDKRYITIEGNPVFQVYMPLSIPDLKCFTDTFRELAQRAGYKGIYLLAGRVPIEWHPIDHGFDGVVGSEFNTLRFFRSQESQNGSFLKSLSTKVLWKLGRRIETDVEKRTAPVVLEYKETLKELITERDFDFDYFPMVVPNWDNTPRAGNSALILKNSTPELWKEHLKAGIKKVQPLPVGRRIVFIKSWNEWAEGNYLEPDVLYGHRYLEVIMDVLEEYRSVSPDH